MAEIERCPQCDDYTVCGHPYHKLIVQANLIALRALWMERAKQLRKDTAYTDCAVTLEACADDLSSLFR